MGGRRMGVVLSLLARLLAAGPASALSVDIVTSVCLEPSLAFIADAAAALEAAGALPVRRFVYCKCAPRPECTDELGNVGREAHTFLVHVSTRYDDLADVSLFTNGGFASKPAAAEDFAEVLGRVGGRLRRGAPFRFLDASWVQEPSPFSRRNGTSADVHALAQEAPCNAPDGCCQQLCESACARAGRCSAAVARQTLTPRGAAAPAGRELLLPPVWPLHMPLRPAAAV
jgi:hypothetical protein